MTDILVTAISGNVATGILRSLGEYDYRLFGCDVGEYPVGMDLVFDWFRVPYASDSTYVSALLEACQQRGIRAVIPANEAELLVLDGQRDLFEKAGITLIMNSSFILESCLDKYTCAKKLSAIGVPVPSSARPNELPIGEGDYILKPCFGCGSKFLKRVSSAEEAQREEKAFGQPLVAQEFLPEDEGEYTMGVFSDGKTTRCIEFRRKLTHGYSSFVELVKNKRMEELGHIVAERWDLRGSINLQMRMKNGEPYVFEVNPRLSGTTHFRSMLGFNDAMWWCETALGNPLPAYTPLYSYAVGLREITEKYIVKRP